MFCSVAGPVCAGLAPVAAALGPAQPPPPVPPGPGGGLGGGGLGGGGLGGGGSAPGSGGDAGSVLGDPIGSLAQNAFSSAMQAIWDAGVFVLRGGFTLADNVSEFDPAVVMGGGQGGGALWPSMLWLSAMIALGLFFFQLASVAVRGGRGMFRAFTGPAQFGIAIAVTTGTIATLLAGADGVTTMFLQSGLGADTFAGLLDNPDVSARIGDAPDLGELDDALRPLVLGVAALFGTIPAGLGFAIQMVFRQAAILVLIATVPICAAGLVADATSSWFWRALRWMLAAILLKPALALVLVVGVNIMARAQGVAGLFAGTAILLVSLFCPMALYRLLAFVDPGTGAGMAVRSGGGQGSSEPGSDGGTSERINQARQLEMISKIGGQGSGAGGTGGELGGSTAATGGGLGGGLGGGIGGGIGGGGGAGSGGASGGAAAGGATVGGGAAAAVVAGYMMTKGAAQKAGQYGSGQMSQTGVGHPGPAPGAGPSRQQAGAASGAAASWAGSTPGPGGTYASGGDSGAVSPGSTGAGSAGTDAAPAVPPGQGSGGPPDVGPTGTAALPSPVQPSESPGPPEASPGPSAPEGPGSAAPAPPAAQQHPDDQYRGRDI